MGSGHFLVNLVDWLAGKALAAIEEVLAQVVDGSDKAGGGACQIAGVSSGTRKETARRAPGGSSIGPARIGGPFVVASIEGLGSMRPPSRLARPRLHPRHGCRRCREEGRERLALDTPPSRPRARAPLGIARGQPEREAAEAAARAGCRPRRWVSGLSLGGWAPSSARKLARGRSGWARSRAACCARVPTSVRFLSAGARSMGSPVARSADRDTRCRSRRSRAQAATS